MKAFENKGRAFIAIVVVSLVGKFLGVARDSVSAYFFGTSDELAAFWVALLILSTVIVLIGDTVNPYVTSTYMDLLSSQDGEAKRFASHWLALMSLFILVLGACLYAMMPIAVTAVVSGFSGEIKTSTIQMARLLLPWLVLSCLVNLLGTIQQCHGKFTVVALNNSVLNIVILLCLGTWAIRIGVQGILLGYNLALLVQLVIHIVAVRRVGISMSLNSLNRADFRDLLAQRKLVIFSKLGWISVIKNVEPLFDYFIGSLIAASAIATFTYAGKINFLVYGLLISPFSAIFLPYLSKLAAENNLEALKDSVNRNIRYYILFLLPAAVFVIFHRLEIIRLLFQRGSFDETATLSTSLALAVMSTCLPFLGILEVLKNAFYGQGKINELLTAYTVGLACKLLAGLTLYKILGGVTIPLAAAAYVIIVTSILLIAHLRPGSVSGNGTRSVAVSVAKTATCLLGGIIGLLIVNNSIFLIAENALIKLVVDLFMFVLFFAICAKVIRHEDFIVCCRQVTSTVLRSSGVYKT